MIKVKQSLFCTLALVAASTSAFAVNSTNVKPVFPSDTASCLPTLYGNENPNHRITADVLPTDSYILLDDKPHQFPMTCNAPMKMTGMPYNTKAGRLTVMAEGTKSDLPV